MLRNLKDAALSVLMAAALALLVVAVLCVVFLGVGACFIYLAVWALSELLALPFRAVRRALQREKDGNEAG